MQRFPKMQNLAQGRKVHEEIITAIQALRIPPWGHFAAIRAGGVSTIVYNE
jgi:hypothetical protein